MKISRLVKALFQKRKKDPVGHYLECIPALEKLCEKEFIGIEYGEKPRVIISTSLHLWLIDDEVKLSRWCCRFLLRIGLVERDRRYRGFMDNVRAYINYKRGVCQPKSLKPLLPEERLDFIVLSMDKKEVLIVGLSQHDKVEYLSAKEAAEEQDSGERR